MNPRFEEKIVILLGVLVAVLLSISFAATIAGPSQAPSNFTTSRSTETQFVATTSFVGSSGSSSTASQASGFTSTLTSSGSATITSTQLVTITSSSTNSTNTGTTFATNSSQTISGSLSTTSSSLLESFTNASSVTTTNSSFSVTNVTSITTTITTQTLRTASSPVNYVSTVLSISCAPNEYQLGLTVACTAEVTPANPISGVVAFNSSPPGSFSPSDCTLSIQGLCSVNYTASGPTTGFYTISATYSGDNSHRESTGSLTIIVAPLGPMTLNCYPSIVSVNVTAVCVASVGNSEDFAYPTGTVVFSANSTGTFSSTACELTSDSSCSVFFTPESLGFIAIRALYEGDSIHAKNSATNILNST